MVRRSDHRYSKTAIAVILSLMLGRLTPAQAQSAKPEKRVFTLEQAVDFALKNYPAVRASLERVRAAEAGVGLARTNYLPRADVLWQANRATDNNITGLLLPQSIIPPITGPVTLSPSNQSAWGSAAGLLFSWEPIDFGYRGAKVDAARATQSRASAEVSLTRLDVSVATSLQNRFTFWWTTNCARGRMRRGPMPTSREHESTWQERSSRRRSAAPFWRTS